MSENFSEALTVEELISILSKVDNKSLQVLVEGCDCFQAAADVEIISKTEVLIVNTMRHSANKTGVPISSI